MNTLWMMDLEDGGPEPPGIAGLRFRELRASDVEDLRRAIGVPDSDIICQRLESGRRCFIGEVAGQIVTYGWVSFVSETIGELELDIHLRPGEAYIWDCATLPAYRGRGYYPALLKNVVHVLGGEGVSLIWIGAKRGNRASARGIEKAGFARVATVLFVRVLRWRWQRVFPAPCAPPRSLAAVNAALR